MCWVGNLIEPFIVDRSFAVSMNKYILLLVFCVFLLISLELSRGENCCVNEHFVDCVNPCNTCAHKDVVCVTICQPGCDCLPGHLRNEFGICIPKQFCEAQKS
ncbi:hypothetical protein NPIL_166831 [Nephila pilipes]|uniref:TIL domain-containing protein n=1 Tax=Nephila pilipes TaxID=299642 RepID=A0A8X6QWE3_NEPPI|nr:hypothetical protein NPIL_166831 [Nephila pilipes]